MEAERQNSKKVFFSGVLLLSTSTILVKAIGLIYKIPMLSYLGSEGMGYFNSAYEIYALFCVIATAGLPVALSVLISGAVSRGDTVQAERIYAAALRIFLAIGLVGCGGMWLLARPLCKWIQSDGAYACILSVAPTVLFVCISSAIRGYFQGFQRMFPTAVSQIVESVGKLVFGLLFASLALRNGHPTEAVASAAGWGLSAGTALSTFYLIVAKQRDRKMQSCPLNPKKEIFGEEKGILRSLCALALPMTLGASLASVTKLIDMAMILRGLQSIGYSDIAANEAYGSYTTMAISVFSLLPTLLNSVSLPLIPLLSAAITARDAQKQRQLIETSYRMTAFFAIPASLGIACFAMPILSLIFKNQEAAVATAAPLLSLLGISVFLSCMITATNAVLHAFRIVKRPLAALLVGCGVKTLVAGFLIGDPSIGLMGAPISSFFCNVTVVLFNFYFVARYAPKISVKRIFFLPLVNGSVSVSFSYLIYRNFAERSPTEDALTLASIALAGFLYLLLSLLSGSFRGEDLRVLPGGERILRSALHFKKVIFKENKQKIGK